MHREDIVRTNIITDVDQVYLGCIWLDIKVGMWIYVLRCVPYQYISFLCGIRFSELRGNMFVCDCKVWWMQRLLNNDANKQFIIDDSITCDNGKDIQDIVIPNCGKTT